MIRRRNALLFVAGFILVLVVGCVGLFAHYGSELRSLTLWHRTHIATLVRQEKPVGRAWVYADRGGDYLVFVEENPDDGPYFLTAHETRAASCAAQPLGRVGSSYILTPVYVGGWKMRCITMDGIKSPETTWMPGENSINFHSVPFDWPPGRVGDWSCPLVKFQTSSRFVGLSDISNNVGSVKYFLSVLLRSLRRVVFLVLFGLCIDDHGSLVISRSASVRPIHLFDPYFDHDY